MLRWVAAAEVLCALALHGSSDAHITYCACCLQVYLIEVNTSPALVRHGEVLKDLLPRVIEEVVQKVGCTAQHAEGGTSAMS